MNVFSFTGNLGSDCRTNTVSGTAVCNFSVAVKAGYGDKQQTNWVDVSLWGTRAEGRLTEYLVKGQQVAVTGELSTREYEGKTYLTVRANDVTLVGSKGDTAPRQASPQATTHQQAAPAGDFDESIPF